MPRTSPRATDPSRPRRAPFAAPVRGVLRHRRRHHAVQADSREHQSETAEHDEDGDARSAASAVVRSTCSRMVMSSPGAMLASSAWISRTSAGAMRRRRFAPCGSGAPRRREILSQRHVEKWFAAFPADCGTWRPARRRPPAAIVPFTCTRRPTGSASAPELRGHRLIHDRHRQRRLVVGASEFAARHQWDPHRGEERRPDFVVVRRRLLVGRSIVSVDGDRRRRIGRGS